MKVYGLTETQILDIINSIPNLQPKRLDTVGSKRPHVEVTLRVRESKGQYARRGQSGHRTIAVCYHGHYRFMAAVYACNPLAHIVSVMASYTSVHDFEASAPNLAYYNVGSKMYTQCFEDACDCTKGE